MDKMDTTQDKSTKNVENVSEIKLDKTSDFEAGTVYLGSIPDGFEEEGMRKFFSQFGVVKRLRLARSRKTGKSQGFAYIEFECDEVAKIVAETMNNYLMFERILKCEFVPSARVTPKLFRGYRPGQPLRYQIVNKLHNKDKSNSQLRHNIRSRISKVKHTKNALSALGLSFNFKVPKCPKKQVTANSSNDTGISSHTLEIDSSEDDITFRTPVGARKMKKIQLQKPIVFSNKGSTGITPFGFKVLSGNNFSTPIPKIPLENKKAHQVNSKQNGFVITPVGKGRKMSKKLSASAGTTFKVFKVNRKSVNLMTTR